MWHVGLSCPRHADLRTRDHTCVCCIGRWNFNHWTPREVPPISFLSSHRGWKPPCTTDCLFLKNVKPVAKSPGQPMRLLEPQSSVREGNALMHTIHFEIYFWIELQTVTGAVDSHQSPALARFSRYFSSLDSVFVWFWYRGEGGFIEWLWEWSLLLSLLEEFGGLPWWFSGLNAGSPDSIPGQGTRHNWVGMPQWKDSECRS